MGLMKDTNAMFVKIKELLEINDIEPVYLWNSNSPNSVRNIMKRQDKLMDELEELAKKHNTILGRVVRFQRADSYAVYLVTKVNKKSARLTWINFCDGWQDERIGYEANVEINFVNQKIEQIDALNKLFKNKVKCNVHA
jgi:hypothetical protein